MYHPVIVLLPLRTTRLPVAAFVLAALAPSGTVGAAEPASALRLIRSESGSRGSVQGNRYVIEDPRATFQAGQDRQIVVLFEWEAAAAGAHAGQASWKDPSGAVVLVAPFQQTAPSRRFSVYWTLALPEAPRLGLWAVETTVDGQPAGVHTFQIQAGAGAAGSRRRLTAPEMYERVQAATLVVESLDGRGTRLVIASGFPIADDLVMTAFQVIDGASRVRISSHGKPPVETDEVAGWNRHQDWAVLRAPGLAAPVLPVERERSQVGDRCSFLDTGVDGARVMTETAIVGAQQFPKAGPRLSLNAVVGPRAVGAPLLNEFGEAIAVLGGALTPGLTQVGMHTTLRFVSLSLVSSPMAVPLSGMPAIEPSASVRLSQLAAKGLFVPPLVAPVNVLTGTLALKVEKNQGIPMPLNEKSEFRRSEKEAVAFLTFDPQERREGMAAFEVYDSDSRKVMAGKPSKLTLRPRQYGVTMWPFPLLELTPGIYRIDLVMNGEPIWRMFFRVVD